MLPNPTFFLFRFLFSSGNYSFSVVFLGIVLCLPLVVYGWCEHHPTLMLTPLGLASQDVRLAWCTLFTLAGSNFRREEIFESI